MADFSEVTGVLPIILDQQYLRSVRSAMIFSQTSYIGCSLLLNGWARSHSAIMHSTVCRTRDSLSVSPVFLFFLLWIISHGPL
jgi:hypothetical protein